MTAQSSILAWRIPWTEEPGGLQSMGSQRVGHDRVTEGGRGRHRGTDGQRPRGGQTDKEGRNPADTNTTAPH